MRLSARHTFDSSSPEIVSIQERNAALDKIEEDGRQ